MAFVFDPDGTLIAIAGSVSSDCLPTCPNARTGCYGCMPKRTSARGAGPTAAWRTRVVTTSTEYGNSLRDRDQRPNGDGAGEYRGAWYWSCAHAGVTRDQVKYAKPNPDLF
jgi:hypothetical protein